MQKKQLSITIRTTLKELKRIDESDIKSILVPKSDKRVKHLSTFPTHDIPFKYIILETGKNSTLKHRKFSMAGFCSFRFIMPYFGNLPIPIKPIKPSYFFRLGPGIPAVTPLVYRKAHNSKK